MQNNTGLNKLLSQQHKQGFALIELMVVLGMLGILLSIAVPGYQQYVLSSYRQEARSELLKLANFQQLLLAEQSRYSANLADFGFAGARYLTASGRYEISAVLTPQGYRVIAQATGVQVKDEACQRFQLDQYGLQSSFPDLGCWQT